MYDLEQSSRRNKSIIINADQRTARGPRRLLLPFQLQLRLRWVHIQSAAFYLRLRLCLGFCFRLGFYFCFCRSLGNLDPCNARVRGCVCTCALAVASIVLLGLGLFLGRVCVGGSVGGYRRSILIVNRLYYRIIRLGLFFLSLSLSLAFLLLFFLLLYIRKNIGQHPIPLSDITHRRTSFSCSRSFASRSFLSFSRNSRSVITQAAAPSAAASGRDLFFNRSAVRRYCQRPLQFRHAPHRTRNRSR